MAMPNVLAAAFAVSLAVGGSALAQTSQQGGYLGSNPGANAGSSKPPSEADMMTNPAAFCMRGSVDPGRCMGRAQADHDYCMAKGRDDYFNCRRTMDYMGWHN